MSERTGWVLVTGDIVCDCHMYGGLPATGPSAAGTGASYAEVAGGAALTHDLLRKTLEARGLAWDEAHKAWETENQRRQQAGEAPQPESELLEEIGPRDAYDAALGLVVPDDLDLIPTHLRSFGVWTAQAKEKDSKERVWRIVKGSHFGYGPFDGKRNGFQFDLEPEHPEGDPVLTIIDDGALGFRNGAAKARWPKFDSEGRGYYLLKTTRPLVCGDLWPEFKAVKKRLIVVVSVSDLRRMDLQIDTELSWEQCAEHTRAALLEHPLGKKLCESAAHVIVTFGSAGAFWVECCGPEGKPVARLLFDPLRLENEYERDMDGTVYGFQTSFTVAIAHHLMRYHLALDDDARKDRSFDEFDDEDGQQADNAAGAHAQVHSPFDESDERKRQQAMRRALQAGIAAGVAAKRELLKLGHGPVDASTPRIQALPVGRTVAESRESLPLVVVPPPCGCSQVGCQWTILTQLELAPHQGDHPKIPLTGLGMATRFGIDALEDVPALRLGPLHTVDRADIESLRTLQNLMREYEETKVQKKPLCLGVFGPPGAGKSFGVRALAEFVLGQGDPEFELPFLEFNLSQFKEPTELIGAFHRVRDEVLKGVTPVAFWDEFDSQGYKWLQYLLAPMQDGTFQEGQIIHPLGKCIFVFAGGTADTYDTFGVREPPAHSAADFGKRCMPQEDDLKRFHEYKLCKGPDFVSRLHGFLNVLGPNQREGTSCEDNSWPIRRAILLRGILKLKDDEQLDIDPGLLYALLRVPKYKHGARSFERVVKTLKGDGSRPHLNRSDLPPRQLLDLDTSAEDFEALLNKADAFPAGVDIDALAAAINRRFCEENKDNGGEPDFAKLGGDFQDSNRSAARRIKDHLALIDFEIKPMASPTDTAWKEPLTEAITRHLERMARAEHLCWNAERFANGWTLAAVTDKPNMKHSSLVPWDDLPASEQAKDRKMVWGIANTLELAGSKAVPVSAPWAPLSAPLAHQTT